MDNLVARSMHHKHHNCNPFPISRLTSHVPHALPISTFDFQLSALLPILYHPANMNQDLNSPTGTRGRLTRALSRLRTQLGPFVWGAALVFVIQRGADVANLVCKLFLGRVLEPLDFGAVEPIFATISMLSLPPAIIYGTAVKSISRLRSQGEDAQCRALVRDLQRLAIVGSALSFVVVFALRHFILTRLHLNSPLFIWMIATMFAMAWWGPLIQAIIRAEYRYRLLSFNSIAGPFLAVGLTILLAGTLSLGLEGAIAARVLSGLIMVAILIVLIRPSYKGNRAPYSEERSAMLKMVLPMAVLYIGATLALNFDRLFVRNFMIEHSAGLSAILMLGQIPGLVIAPISFVLFPMAAAEHASGRALERLMRRATTAGILITVASSLGLALVATPVLRFWRPEFAPYGRYVWVYALMTGLRSLNGVLATIEMARHEYRFLWFFALPTLLACAALYIAQDYSSLTITLPTVLWTLVAAHLTTFITITAQLAHRPVAEVQTS